jgi:hypothetical protein
MLDTIENTEAELPLVEQPTKRELIEDALRTDPKRSDREIARICGVDHKTVGSVRGKLLPIASPSVSPAACPPPPGIIDPPKEPDYDPFDDPKSMVLRGQPPTAIYFNNFEQVVICQQRDCSDDDPFIYISTEHLPTVILKLQQMLKAATKP